MSTEKLNKERKFKAWMWWLTRTAVIWCGFKDGTVFSPEHWKVYFDEGLHVHEALREDFKHA